LAGVTLAFGGILMFLSDKLLGGNWRAGGGDLVLLVAAAFFSYYTVAVKPVMQRHGPVLTMGYATVLGGLLIRVGDVVYDGSVDGQLKQLRAATIAKAEQTIRDKLSSLAS
jgi:drug/metabolite transporter (DMT)-like permease